MIFDPAALAAASACSRVRKYCFHRSCRTPNLRVIALRQHSQPFSSSLTAPSLASVEHACFGHSLPFALRSPRLLLQPRQNPLRRNSSCLMPVCGFVISPQTVFASAAPASSPQSPAPAWVEGSADTLCPAWSSPRLREEYNDWPGNILTHLLCDVHAPDGDTICVVKVVFRLWRSMV